MNQIKLLGLNYRNSIMSAKVRCMLLSKENEDPEVPSIGKRRNEGLNQKLQHPILIP